MSTERFVISQLEAHFAKDADLIGKQDPYVVFELGSEKITTPAIKSGGMSCNWEESFTLTGRNEASDLQATVYNKNTLRPDGMLGMATHRILHKTEPGKLKMELTDKKGNNTGEILFILQASGGRFAQQGGNTSSTRGTGAGTGSGTGSGIGSGTGSGIGSGTGTGAGYGSSGTGTGAGYGSSGTGTGAGLTGAAAGLAAGASGRSTGSEERRNQTFEGTTASGARSGATGATGAGYSSGTTGSGSGTGGVTEGVRGLNLTSESGYGASGAGGSTTQTNNPICDTKYYTKIEDRPVVKQITTFVREHHPVEKEFVVETRPTGQEREQTQGRTQEVVDTKERVVEVTQPNPCGGVPTSQVVGSGTGTGVSSGRTGI